MLFVTLTGSLFWGLIKCSRNCWSTFPLLNDSGMLTWYFFIRRKFIIFLIWENVIENKYLIRIFCPSCRSSIRISCYHYSFFASSTSSLAFFSKTNEEPRASAGVSYHEFLINEASYKFWAIFQVIYKLPINRRHGRVLLCSIIVTVSNRRCTTVFDVRCHLLR